MYFVLDVVPITSNNQSIASNTKVPFRLKSQQHSEEPWPFNIAIVLDMSKLKHFEFLVFLKHSI
jgi:hypothetical protein